MSQELNQCPICMSDRIFLLYRGIAVRTEWQDGKKWPVWSCRSCQHAFTNPQPSPNQLEKYYDANYTAYSDDHGTTDFDSALRTAKKFHEFRYVRINQGLRILDVGCGGGFFLRICRELGAEIFGVEPSKHGVKTCRANAVPVFHGSLTEYIETKPLPFDLVTCNHVIEHHPRPVDFLKEMASLKTPDGKVWMSVPNASSIFSRILRYRWHSSDLPVHLHHFSIHSFQKAVQMAELNIDNLQTASAGSVPSSVSQILRYRFLLPRRLTLPLIKVVVPDNGFIETKINKTFNGEAILSLTQ